MLGSFGTEESLRSHDGIFPF